MGWQGSNETVPKLSQRDKSTWAWQGCRNVHRTIWHDGVTIRNETGTPTSALFSYS